jgi:hypothetical protein
VDCLHSTKIKFSLMNLRLLKRQSRRPNICMTKAKAEYIFRSLGEIRKRTSKIRGRRDLNLLLQEQS